MNTPCFLFPMEGLLLLISEKKFNEALQMLDTQLAQRKHEFHFIWIAWRMYVLRHLDRCEDARVFFDETHPTVLDLFEKTEDVLAMVIYNLSLASCNEDYKELQNVIFKYCDQTVHRKALIPIIIKYFKELIVPLVHFFSEHIEDNLDVILNLLAFTSFQEDIWFEVVFPKVFLLLDKLNDNWRPVFFAIAAYMKSFYHAHLIDCSTQNKINILSVFAAEPDKLLFIQSFANGGKFAFRICANCNRVSKTGIKSCSRCRGFYYCSDQCNKTHWKVHKEFCLKK